MKKFLALLLASLMLLSACGPTEGNDTTAPTTDTPEKVERFDYSIDVIDDTYVLDRDNKGNHSSENFSTEKYVALKTNTNGFNRYGYFKFDISSLVGDTDFTAIEFDLTLESGQTFEASDMEVYGCAPSCDPSTVTFKTQPQNIELIYVFKSVTQDMNTVSLPITDYVKYAINKGQK